MNTERIFIKNLNANDSFRLPGVNTTYTVESRRTMGNMTTVVYRCGDFRGTFTKVNLTTADLMEV